MKINEYCFTNNYVKNNNNNKTTLSTIKIGNLKNLTYFSEIDNINSHSKNPINQGEKKLIHFDTDDIGHNKIFFTNLLNNQITIINNIYQNKKLKDHSNSENKSQDSNNENTKKIEKENISLLNELNIQNLIKNK